MQRFGNDDNDTWPLELMRRLTIAIECYANKGDTEMVRANGSFASLGIESNDFTSRNVPSDLLLGSPDSANPVTSGIRRIVVPLDGSRHAEHALPHAIAIARRSGASINLANVFALSEWFDSGEMLYHRAVVHHNHGKSSRYVSSVADRVGAVLNRYVKSTVIDDNDVAGAIGRLSDAETLVVMSTGSRAYLKSLLIGSVAERLIHKLEGPLLLIRGSKSPIDLSSEPLPRHILLPLDGTECAERAIALAMRLGALAGARYSLVHLRDAGRMVNRTEIEAANAYLKDLARRSMTGGRSLETKVLVSERAIASDLLEFATKENADWIAVTAHTRPLWIRLLHRSVAKSVIRRAQMPLLIVRHALEPEEECEQVLMETLWS